MNTSIIKLNISDLLLDPNNYRFIDADNYNPVSEDKYADEKVQANTLRLVMGKGNENIYDLVSSFKANGFINDGEIQVRKLEQSNKYLVVEGNRRISTLLYFQKLIEDGYTFERISSHDFENIVVKEIIDMDIRSYKIAMGLQHVAGKKKWNPINQAQLIYDLIYDNGVPEDEVCSSLGLSKLAVRKSIRTLMLIKAYRESDFGDQMHSAKYSFFEEAIKNPQMRNWLGWNDETKHCENTIHQEWFFSWISNTTDEDGNEIPAIIDKSVDVRRLTSIIENESALRHLVESHSLDKALAFSTKDNDADIQYAIGSIESILPTLLVNYDKLNKEDLSRLKQALSSMNQVANRDEIRLGVFTTLNVFNEINCHFSEVKIHSFRGIREMTLQTLSNVNLFVGENNCGKTSLLEAVYMLTQQNNIKRYLEMEQMRSKIQGTIHTNWLVDYVANSYFIEGTFNTHQCSVKFSCKPEESYMFDKNNYLTTLSSWAIVGGINDGKFKSDLHLYSDKQPVLNYNKIANLCSSALSSSYRRNFNSIMTAHRIAVEKGMIPKIVEFLSANIDEKIINIQLTGEDGSYRFIVTTKNDNIGLDLTKFGEGIQRAFEISLFIAACSNGCLFIDEIDSAIHKNILPKFIEFVISLCNQCNVQLFVTTHSRECIDIFANTNLGKDLSVYRLRPLGADRSLNYTDGESLKEMIDTFDVDIR